MECYIETIEIKYTLIIFQRNEMRTETYNVGAHVSVTYDDGKSDTHPFNFANGTIAEVGNNFIVVKESDKDVYIEFDWICEIQDESHVTQ